MRMHPPNHILLNKLVPPQGDTLKGYHVPGGTKIAWNLWSLLRSKSMFGEDSYLFRPERWLEVDSERKLEMERHVELIFGYGRYMCAGKTVAFMELNKFYFEV
jgi:cytochrome P450